VIYWDTSAIIKLYVEESDSALWEKVAMDERHPRVSSMLLEAEFSFAVRQKEQRGEVKPGGAAHLVKMLRRDVTRGYLQLYPLNAEVMTRTVELALHEAKHVPMRTLDGLHLASALLLDTRLIATADVRMKAAALRVGLALVDPTD